MSVTVLVDDREPERLVDAVRTHPDVASVDVARLVAGDLVIGEVGFERKTAGDYVGSAMGRTGSDLETQVRQLDEAYVHAYVLVEGTFGDMEASWPGIADASVRGSAASITARLGVPVIPCGTIDRLVDLAVRLGRKHAEPAGTRPVTPGAVTDRREPIAMRMYACIEGVGPTTAAALYEAFPTVESLLAATESDLQAVEGVGPKRAAAIYAAFRSEE